MIFARYLYKLRLSSLAQFFCVLHYSSGMVTFMSLFFLWIGLYNEFID